MGHQCLLRDLQRSDACWAYEALRTSSLNLSHGNIYDLACFFVKAATCLAGRLAAYNLVCYFSGVVNAGKTINYVP